MVKNPKFDVMLGVAVLSNYPEGNMWYEMSQKKDLVFLQIPEELRQKLAKEFRGELVNLPFRYLRGLDDEPHPTVGFSGLSFTDATICQTNSCAISPAGSTRSARC